MLFELMKKVARPTFLALALSYLATGCAPSFISEIEKIDLQDAPCAPFSYTSHDQRTIAGVKCKPDKHSAPVLVFLHGAPGNWKGWKQYLKDKDLNQNYEMVAVDRPGYGGSDPGKPEYSLRTQSRLIREAVKEQIGTKPYTVIGHSFGGPVAVQMAIDDPTHAQKILLLAPSIDPALEKVEWYQKLADTQVMRWFVPQALDVCNQEIIALGQELSLQATELGKLRQSIFMIQGGKDDLVPPENADYAKRMFTGAQLNITMLPHQNHFLPWKEYDLVKSSIQLLTTKP